MSTCQSCGGILGRDCFNPQECAEITAQMSYQSHDETATATITALEAEVGRLRGLMSQASTLITVAMNTDDPQSKAALIHAALDFASDDTEALAEGAKWAPVDPAEPDQ